MQCKGFSNRGIFKMFSRVSGFLNPKLVSPKPMKDAAFDKAFWATHYMSVIEELAEELRHENITTKSLVALEERLVECQGMIGRYTLSPKCYEEGIQDLIASLQENKPKADYLSCIAMLNRMLSDFQASLIEQPDFTRECLMGDVDHCVGQWKAGTISASYFAEAMVYYVDVMPVADYYDGLEALKNYFQAKGGFDPLREAIHQLLLTVDRREVEQSSNGQEDLIIGTGMVNNAVVVSYVFFDHAGPWTTPFSLSSLNGANGFTLTQTTLGQCRSSVVQSF